MTQKLLSDMIEKGLDPVTISLIVMVGSRSSKSSIKSYLNRYPFGPDTINKAVSLGFIYFPHGSGLIENAKLTEVYSANVEENMEMGEELWTKYPAALPLGGGGMFIARKGPDKYEVINLYLERIQHSPEKHEFVLEQLQVYIKLVLDSKINGHRIHDWISNEMWDIIPALQAGAKGEFKTDI